MLLVMACAPAAPAREEATNIDTDLLEVTIPRLHELYDARKYTVTEVVQWHLARIHKYDGIYRAVEHVMDADALALAARQDDRTEERDRRSEARCGASRSSSRPTPASPARSPPTAGPGSRIPGHELVAPRDATVVAKLRAAGAIIIGHTNMPDFANSDTNRSSSFGRTGNAYDVRFSPGGSSGGTVTAVTANMAVLGTGTDTGNSIRMPAATSALIGVYPTRGLVSTAGIAPLDWLLDNTGPIARNVTDAAIALSVMAGPDPLDARTEGSAGQCPARAVPAVSEAGRAEGQALRRARLHPRRDRASRSTAFTPRFPRAWPPSSAQGAATPLQPETRAGVHEGARSVAGLGATVVIDDTHPPRELRADREPRGHVSVRAPGHRAVPEGRSVRPSTTTPADYARAVGAPLSSVIIGDDTSIARIGDIAIPHRRLETDPDAEANYHGPRRRTLEAYLEPLDRLQLDGYVYPAIQMPPPDETMPQDGGISGGPHSATSWVNMIGVPAVVVVGGQYPGGLPFGLEFSARPVEGRRPARLRATRGSRRRTIAARRVLVEQGLLPKAP